MAQLVDHRLAEHGSFGRVMQDVKADQPRVEIAVKHRYPISDFDIESRA